MARDRHGRDENEGRLLGLPAALLDDYGTTGATLR